jgi:hypothetical protein
MVDGHGNEPGYGQARIAETFARAQLVRAAAAPSTGCGNPSPATRAAMTVGRSPTTIRPSSGLTEADSRMAATGGVLVVEADRNRLVLPRILNQVTPIRRENEFGPEPRGGVTERARLVAGRRRQ